MSPQPQEGGGGLITVTHPLIPLEMWGHRVGRGRNNKVEGVSKKGNWLNSSSYKVKLEDGLSALIHLTTVIYCIWILPNLGHHGVPKMSNYTDKLHWSPKGCIADKLFANLYIIHNISALNPSIYLSIYKVTDRRLLTPTPDPYQSQNMCHPKRGKDTSFTKCSAVSVKQNKHRGTGEMRGMNWRWECKVGRGGRRCAHRRKAPINHWAVLHASCDKWNRIMVSVRSKIWATTALTL